MSFTNYGRKAIRKRLLLHLLLFVHLLLLFFSPFNFPPFRLPFFRLHFDLFLFLSTHAMILQFTHTLFDCTHFDHRILVLNVHRLHTQSLLFSSSHVISTYYQTIFGSSIFNVRKFFIFLSLLFFAFFLFHI